MENSTLILFTAIFQLENRVPNLCTAIFQFFGPKTKIPALCREYGVQGSGFRVQEGSGFGVQGSGFRVQEMYSKPLW
jgi:hypothetical protein